MPSSSEMSGDGTARVSVQIPVAELDNEYRNAARRIAGQRKIPGFRPGKAPPAVVERMFGSAAIKLEAIERLVPRSFDRAVTEQNLEMAGQPDLEYPQLESVELDFSVPFEFAGTIPLVPTVELGSTEQISLRRRSADVSDAEIEMQLEAIRAARAESVDIDDPERELVSTDIAKFDFSEIIDGNARVERDGLAVSMENPGFADGFADAVLGMTTGQKREFELAYAEDSPIASVAGKTASYTVTLTGITERTLPELNDAFANSVAEVETVADLRDRMREDVGEHRRREDEGRIQSEAFSALCDRSNFVIAERLIADQAHQLLDARVADLTRRGMAVDTYLAQRGLDHEAFHQQAHEDAEDLIRNAVVTRQFAEDRSIEVTLEDVDQRLDEMFATYPVGEQDALRSHYLSQVPRERIQDQLLQERVLTQLLSEIDIADPEVEAAAEGEVEAEIEAADAAADQSDNKPSKSG